MRITQGKEQKIERKRYIVRRIIGSNSKTKKEYSAKHNSTQDYNEPISDGRITPGQSNNNHIIT